MKNSEKVFKKKANPKDFKKEAKQKLEEKYFKEKSHYSDLKRENVI